MTTLKELKFTVKMSILPWLDSLGYSTLPTCTGFSNSLESSFADFSWLICKAWHIDCSYDKWMVAIPARSSSSGTSRWLSFAMSWVYCRMHDVLGFHWASLRILGQIAAWFNTTNLLSVVFLNPIYLAESHSDRQVIGTAAILTCLNITQRERWNLDICFAEYLCSSCNLRFSLCHIGRGSAQNMADPSAARSE